MKRLYVITSKKTGEVLAVSHGRSIDCRNMPDDMYVDSECNVKDLPNAEADKLLKLKWKFAKAD